MSAPRAISESQDVQYRAFLANYEVKMQQCTSCKVFRHPARWICPECLGQGWEWIDLSLNGEIEYFVWYMQPLDPSFSDVPYNVAIVRVEEGPCITTNVLGAAMGELSIGQPVRLEVGRSASGKPLLFCRSDVSTLDAK
jgi:uncharacterized OB-fold protein